MVAVNLGFYNAQVRELIHDLATVDWTDAELAGYINNARQRTALDAHCVRTFFVGLNLIANQEVYPITGGIGGYTITAAGANYAAPRIVVAAPGGTGITATAVATQTGGAITSVLPTSWGSAYSAAPVVTVLDTGPGAGATVAPIFLQNVLDVVSATVIWPGNLNARTLNWSPFSEFQAWRRAWRQSFGWPDEWSHIMEMNQLYFARVPDQAYTLELDTVTLPLMTLVNLTDVDTDIIQPFADCVQWYASYLAILKLQNYTHAQYFEKAYEKRLLQVVNTQKTRRIRNIYMNSYRRRLRGG